MDQQVHNERNVIHDILSLIKQNILLILIVIIACLSAGWVYSTFRKPKYITEEQVLFSMGNGTSITGDINTMYAYKPTVMDFADNGVVVDRANFYANYLYKKYDANVGGESKLQSFIDDVLYLEERILSCNDEITALAKLYEIKEEIINLEEYGVTSSEKALYDKFCEEAELLRQQAGLISKIREVKEQIKQATDQSLIKILQANVKDLQTKLVEVRRGTLNVVDYQMDAITQIENKIEQLNTLINNEKQNDLYYQADKVERVTGYISSSQIAVVDYVDTTESKSFAFGVRYTDSNEELSKENVRLLVLAFDIESSYFFEGMYPHLEDLGMASCSVDMTSSMILLASGLLGVVLSCLIIYLKKVFDKTIKDKEVAEMITGVKVMACIDRQEDVNNG